MEKRNYWGTNNPDPGLMPPGQWIPIAVAVFLFALLCVVYCRVRRWRGREKIVPIEILQPDAPNVGNRWRRAGVGWGPGGGWRNTVAEWRLNAQLDRAGGGVAGHNFSEHMEQTDSAGEPFGNTSTRGSSNYEPTEAPTGEFVGWTGPPAPPRESASDSSANHDNAIVLPPQTHASGPPLQSTAPRNPGEPAHPAAADQPPENPRPAVPPVRPPSPLVRFQRRNAQPTFAHATLSVASNSRSGSGSDVSPEMFEAMGGREPRVERGAPAIVIYGRLAK